MIAFLYLNRITLFWQVRFRRGLPPGDGVLFYPGQAFEPELTEPVASIRLERLLGGLQVKEALSIPYSASVNTDVSIEKRINVGL